MNGNCHFVFGASVGSALALNIEKISHILPGIPLSSEMQVLFIFGGLIGGIFPDIDNPSSHMGKLTVPVSSCIGAVNELFGKTGKNHRGILHDPILYIAGLVLSYLYCPAWCGFFTGCLSHLLLDMFNPAGIPLLWKHIHLGRIVSGSQESVLFTWILTIIVLIAGMSIRYS